MTGFKWRVIALLLMFLLGFIGVIVTDFTKDGAWHYWRFLAFAYGVISLALSWHLIRRGWRITLVTVWHEIAHWAGLIGAVFICSYFVKVGLIGSFAASFFMLLLLALATFLAGVYIEPFLIVLGITLGGFAIGIAFVDEYLYNILLPLALIGATLAIFVIHYTHKKIKNM